MNAKQSMKNVRDFLRRQMDLIRKDPYLAPIAPHLEVRIERWDEIRHEVYVVVRDRREEDQGWNTSTCQHAWIWTESQFYKGEMFVLINKVVCNMMLEAHKNSSH
jgi:hypothetical protein